MLYTTHTPASFLTYILRGPENYPTRAVVAWGCLEGKNKRKRTPPPPIARARRVTFPCPQPPWSELLQGRRPFQNRSRTTTNKRGHVDTVHQHQMMKIEHRRRARRKIGNPPHFVISEQTTAPSWWCHHLCVSEQDGDMLYGTYTNTPSEFSTRLTTAECCCALRPHPRKSSIPSHPKDFRFCSCLRVQAPQPN